MTEGRCFIDLSPDIEPVRGETYEEWRRRIIANGGFTVFYATSTRKIANWATRLGKDPTVILTPKQFPWTQVLEVQP